MVGPDVEFDGASFDSRTLRPGQLFVPIVADRDGHHFIPDAARRGASVYLTSRPVADDLGPTAVVVADTGSALIEVAAAARRRLEGPVVGITGSVGKTTTKDFVGAAVGAGRRVSVNSASFNNDQGLPVTILDAPDDVEVLVTEMGMRGFGEISRLCRIARPTIGVVTAVGHSHTELVGGIEGVAVAKRELVEALPASGVAILNADDVRVAAMADHTDAAVLTYGAAGDVRIVDLHLDEMARASFRILTPWGDGTVRLALPGAHMAANASAAIAVAGSVGVDVGSAADALATTAVSRMRMEVLTSATGATIVNDAYNANPTSMGAAIDALAGMRARRRVAVLGLMAEIDDPIAAHRAVAERVASLGIELVPVGTALYGAPPVDRAADSIGPLGDGDVVLVKASRAAGLERVVAELLG
jgi:UDP-N-acetylmuramoyl-tripeptide--D-alanyl-D-alanine ligase